MIATFHLCPGCGARHVIAVGGGRAMAGFDRRLDPVSCKGCGAELARVDVPEACEATVWRDGEPLRDLSRALELGPDPLEALGYAELPLSLRLRLLAASPASQAALAGALLLLAALGPPECGR